MRESLTPERVVCARVAGHSAVQHCARIIWHAVVVVAVEVATSCLPVICRGGGDS